MKEDLPARTEAYADDTVNRINFKKKLGKLTRGRFRHCLSDPRPRGGDDRVIPCMDSSADWKSDSPRKYPGNYVGLIQTDACPSWLSLEREAGGQIIVQLCLANAGCKFVDAIRKFSGATREERAVARKRIGLIGKQFDVGRNLYGRSPEQRLQGGRSTGRV